MVYLSAGDSELLVLDVSQRAQPKLAALHGAVKDMRGAWGLALTKDRVYLTYIVALIPFQGTWAGIRAVER